MTLPGIRAASLNKFFFAPFPGTQFDPPATPSSPPHTYHRGIRSRTRPHVNSRYDVRATYPAIHPLCKHLNKNNARMARVFEPSIDDFFATASVPEDDAFLVPLWERMTGVKHGLETERRCDNKESTSFQAPSVYQSFLVLLLLILMLTFLDLPSTVSLCAVYALSPLTLSVGDGSLRISLRGERTKKSWFCVVVGLLVGNWWMSRWGGSTVVVSMGESTRMGDDTGEYFVDGG